MDGGAVHARTGMPAWMSPRPRPDQRARDRSPQPGSRQTTTRLLSLRPRADMRPDAMRMDTDHPVLCATSTIGAIEAGHRFRVGGRSHGVQHRLWSCLYQGGLTSRTWSVYCSTSHMMGVQRGLHPVVWKPPAAKREGGTTMTWINQRDCVVALPLVPNTL